MALQSNKIKKILAITAHPDDLELSFGGSVHKWFNQGCIVDNLIMCHHNWIKSVLNQMKEIKIGLKGYRYLDEALELSSELGLKIDEAEIIRTNSTGLVIYNPKNLAARIKGMKNKEKTREQKIAERLAYNQQSQAVN